MWRSVREVWESVLGECEECKKVYGDVDAVRGVIGGVGECRERCGGRYTS